MTWSQSHQELGRHCLCSRWILTAAHGEGCATPLVRMGKQAGAGGAASVGSLSPGGATQGGWPRPSNCRYMLLQRVLRPESQSQAEALGHCPGLSVAGTTWPSPEL